MSKWLRRGFGNNNNSNNTSDERLQQTQTPVSEFPTPPRNDLMPASAAAVTAYHHQHHASPSPHHHPSHHNHPQSSAASPNITNMAQFETAVAMDVDNTPTSSRNKYAQTPPSYHPPSSKPYESSSARNRAVVSAAAPQGVVAGDASSAAHRSSSSSNRPSSRDRRSRSTFSAQQVQPPQQPQPRQPQGGMMHGATNAPPNMMSAAPSPNTSSQLNHMAGGQFGVPSSPAPHSLNNNIQQHQQVTTPYGSSNKDPLLAGAATPPPPDSSSAAGAQPSFPPPAVTADSPQPSEVSQRRPAYLLHRDLVIGKGSYGQVCIASRGEPEGHSSGRSGKRKKFACKCVLLRSDPKYIAKLQEEVNVLRELRGHPNVIRLFDVFCVDNELFIITELGRGGDLFHLLTTHPKHGVTEAYAAKTVSEMLSAVAFLHARNICHRDLKLENWVLESGKDVWSPLKLIDFGLSTHFSPGQRLSRVVGSSYYVAPEVLKKSYTEACDLWSLGVIVYMLLSGAPPFYGKNDEAIKASIVQGEYTFPHELFRDVSDEAMAFVSTLLSYNIEYRYTAEQALTHPWLAANCDPEALQRAKDGARGIGISPDIISHNNNTSSRLDPMQL